MKKKAYEHMPIIELVKIARAKSIPIPASLSFLKGVAEPSQEDIEARRHLIDSLNSLDHKAGTNWAALGVIIALAALIVSAAAIYL